MVFSDSPAVGVLALHDSRETKAICAAVERLGGRARWLHRGTVGLWLREDRASVEPPVDVVVNRLLLSKSDRPLEELAFAAALAPVVPVVNEPAAVLTAVHKFATATRLAAAGVPTPDGYIAPDGERLAAARPAFGPHAVYKTAVGTNGRGVWLLEPGEGDERVAATVDGRWAFLQEYVDAGRDLRAYVVDGEVVGTMYRYPPEGDWRSNVALGGRVEDATGRHPDVERVAVAAADAVGLDVAGVDVVEAPDGPAVLEVNPTAGFRGLYRATGVNPAAHVAALALRRAGARVDEADVRAAARSFETLVPPEGLPPGSTPPVIGRTELVTVAGVAGSRPVLAAADTDERETLVAERVAADVDAARPECGSHVDLLVQVDGASRRVSARVVEDPGEAPLLFGRDVLGGFYVDVGREAGVVDGPAMGSNGASAPGRRSR